MIYLLYGASGDASTPMYASVAIFWWEDFALALASGTLDPNWTGKLSLRTLLASDRCRINSEQQSRLDRADGIVRETLSSVLLREEALPYYQTIRADKSREHWWYFLDP